MNKDDEAAFIAQVTHRLALEMMFNPQLGMTNSWPLAPAMLSLNSKRKNNDSTLFCN
jgi:hypothetical protein